MILQNLLGTYESYPFENEDWCYTNLYVGFSRLYYVIDGEAYYEEDGTPVMLKKNHLYLTPVKKRYSLYENPNNRPLHTYAHLTTMPPVNRFIEVEVKEGTALADAVAMWRKYVFKQDMVLLTDIVRFILARIGSEEYVENSTAAKVKYYIDHRKDYDCDMAQITKSLGYSREHITRAFLAAYGITPMQYFRQCRMNAALSHLLAGERINQVADYFGFATPYSFSKAFKDHFGLSPEKYLMDIRGERQSDTKGIPLFNGDVPDKTQNTPL